jgi:uncharacterized membrane protein SirB2
LNLAEHYPLLRTLHIGFVFCSGALFALRGAAVLAGARWPMTPAARVAAVCVDTGIVAAALALLAALHLNPFTTPWIATKLALLVVYVVLGTFALRRARTRRGRAGFYAAALGTFAFMLGVALAHDPHGWFAWVRPD